MDIIIIALGLVTVALLLTLVMRRPASTNLNIARLEERLIRVEAELDKLTPKIEQAFRENRKEIADNLQQIQHTVDARVKCLQDDNTKKLEEMRLTVDEKLQQSVERRFNESFKQISNQLTQVYQGLGEMKTLANGVGDLKKVMEGVKTRGIYGEVQLGNIVSNYARLIDAYKRGHKDEIEQFRKALAIDVKEQAKKISSKYLDPPATTDFGVMFMPTESLYAEILRIAGLSDEIRQKYNVIICSPSTLPVILSGLTMGFRSVAIEKRSAEVWQTLGAVKTQFGKFGDLLAMTKKKLEETANKIGSAEATSRQIERKLKTVETLPEYDSVRMIGEIKV